MLLVDVGAAMVAAIIVLAITPGLAVAGLIAIVVLTACGVGFRRGSQRRRRARSGRRRTARPAQRARSRSPRAW